MRRHLGPGAVRTNQLFALLGILARQEFFRGHIHKVRVGVVALTIRKGPALKPRRHGGCTPGLLCPIVQVVPSSRFNACSKVRPGTKNRTNRRPCQRTSCVAALRCAAHIPQGRSRSANRHFLHGTSQSPARCRLYRARHAPLAGFFFARSCFALSAVRHILQAFGQI